MKKLLLSTVFTLSLASAVMAEDAVIATVNGQKIYNSELQRNLNEIPNFDSLPTEQQKIIKDKIIDAITKLTAVVQEAEKLNIKHTPKYVNQLKDVEQQLMYSTLLETHLDNIITDSKLKKYYEDNKSKYIVDKAKASHILVETKKEAEEIIQKLTAGEDFATIAKAKSIGPSAKVGGDLGWFDKETMVGPFSDAVFKLKEKEFTKTPVKTQFGWHVILLEEKIENTPSLFDDVKEQIKQEVMQEEVEKYLDEILDKADISIENENE